MELLVDLFGYLSVIVHGLTILAQSVALGGALFLALRATDLQVVEHLREWFSSQRAAALEVQSADAGADGVQVRVKLSPG